MRKILRKIISKLVNYTPGVFYYSSTLQVEIAEEMREMYLSKMGQRSALGSACMAMCCAVGNEMEPGDVLKSTLTGVVDGDDDVGDFTVVITKL